MAEWIRPSIYVHGCTIRCVCVYGCNRQGTAWLRAKRVDRKEIPLLTLGRRGHTPQRNVATPRDRKSTRLNSSHVRISYAVFCLKKKKKKKTTKEKTHMSGEK